MSKLLLSTDELIKPIDFINPVEGVLIAHTSIDDINTIIHSESPSFFLSESEQQALNQRTSISAKHSFLASRWLCKYLASQLIGGQASDWQIRSLSNGAPQLHNAYGVFTGSISISHSRERIACIISKIKRPLGIDIERLSNRAQLREILAMISHTHELTWYDANPELERFYALWTAKEAVAKAHQTSIWNALDDQASLTISNDQAQNWHSQSNLEIHHFHHRPTQHMGAWAIGRPS